jgi:hypothetical protein
MNGRNTHVEEPPALSCTCRATVLYACLVPATFSRPGSVTIPCPAAIAQSQIHVSIQEPQLGPTIPDGVSACRPRDIAMYRHTVERSCQIPVALFTAIRKSHPWTASETLTPKPVMVPHIAILALESRLCDCDGLATHGSCVTVSRDTPRFPPLCSLVIQRG